jgi:hypothetical protein
MAARWRRRCPAALVCLGVLLVTGRAGAQQPAPVAPAAEGDAAVLRLQLPRPDRLFRVESEALLKERMIREARQAREPYEITFPDEPVVSRQVYAGRDWQPLVEVIEPGYVCYRRLYFEQINTERYGRNIGCLQPLLSAGIFYLDVVTLPYHMGTELCRRYECSAGYPLPGDPVPGLRRRPKLSATGALSEAATILLLAAIFP